MQATFDPTTVALVQRTAKVLDDMALGDIEDLLARRVYRPDHGLVREADVWRLSPFAELLVRHLLWIATRREWNSDERRSRARDAFVMAGF